MGKNHFINEWLEVYEEKHYSDLSIINFKEKDNKREKIRNKLIETIISYYIKDHVINSYLSNDDKFYRLENYINGKLPHMGKTRKGDFGEIIGTEHIKQEYGYCFPVIKLRYKKNNETSEHGEDILGFIIENNKIVSICIAESKIRSKYSKKPINDAHDQLKSSYIPVPKVLNFIFDILDERNDEFASEVENLFEPKNFMALKKDNIIFTIFGSLPSKNLKVDNTKNELENLKIITIFLPNISDFIDEIYNECAVYYNESEGNS